MKKSIIAGLLLSSQAFAGGLLFDVQSSNEGLTIPLVLCLDGKSEMSCQKFTAQGLNLSVKTTTTRTTSYSNAGIKVMTSGFKLSGCTPYGNGYCLFPVTSFGYVSLGLK